MKREAPTSTKMRRLYRLLDAPVYHAVGMLELLWHLTAREAPQGDIGKLSNEDIALAIDWRGDPNVLIKALCDSRWLDDDHPDHRLLVHDWSEHSDDAVDVKLARSGKHYADGRQPRMNRLSAKEREKLCAAFGWNAGPCAQKRTKAHEKPLPVPVPVPVPNTVSQNSAFQETSGEESISSSQGEPAKGRKAPQADVSSNSKAVKKKTSAKKRKAEEPEPPPDPRHNPCRVAFDLYFRQKVRKPAPWGGREAKALSDFLKVNPTITVQDWETILSNRAISPPVTHAYPLSKWIGTALSWLNGPADDWGHTITGAENVGSRKPPARQKISEIDYERELNFKPGQNVGRL